MTTASVRENIPLAGMTTFRIGGAARFFAEPRTETECRDLLEWARARGAETFFLGGGSNLLVDDGGVDGLAARLSREGPFGLVEREGTAGATLAAGGAAQLARLVGAAADCGLAGLEAWAAIPGTVGGALAMNAGGRVGLCDLAESVETMARDGTVRRWRRGELRHRYRDGGFGGDWILRAEFRLAASTPGAVRRGTAEAARRKAAAQPLAAASAGCVFGNPPEGVSAGELVDRAGLKGAREGGAAVSERHANFIVNAGGATARDVRTLVERVRKTVEARFGVSLAPEIRGWPGRRMDRL